MVTRSVICDGCGHVCLDGEFLTLPVGAGSVRLRNLWGDERQYCPECTEGHDNLDRQRRHEGADTRPVRVTGALGLMRGSERNETTKANETNL